jgi:hypothetical protein
VITVVRGPDAHVAAWRVHAVVVGLTRRSLHALAQAALVEALTAGAVRVLVWLVAAAPPDASVLAPPVWDALRRRGWTLAPAPAIPTPLVPSQWRMPGAAPVVIMDQAAHPAALAPDAPNEQEACHVAFAA